MTHCSVTGQASLPVQTQLLTETMQPGQNAFSERWVVRELAVRDTGPVAPRFVREALTSCCIVFEAGGIGSAASRRIAISDTMFTDLIAYCQSAARTA